MTISHLSDVRVIDLTQFLPGPYAAQVFADLGADVLKVEPPGGDPMRSLNPVTASRGRAPFHEIVNAGKRVVRIDLKSDGGKRAFEQLIASADVLIESYRPGVMDRLGLGYDYLKTLNSKLIHCALSGYGQTGPFRERSGHDINYVAMSGGLHMTGPENTPLQAFPPVADYAGAMQTVIAIQAALLGRSKTGEGAYLDVAMADTMVSWQAFGLIQQDLSETADTSAPARSAGLLNGGAACYQVYQTRDDRFISLGAIETHFWENFCQAIDHPEWISRQLEPLPQTELISEVAGLIKRHDRAYWDNKLDNVDCCYHPVLEYTELADWPQIQNRQLIDKNPLDGAFQGIRYPVWENGAPSPQRPPMQEVSIEQALTSWD